MGLGRKNWKSYVFLGVSLFCVYAISRLWSLAGQPIFTDEAIYIRWSQIGTRDANWRFISLTDGKQPLFTWIMMGTLRVFSDPLFGGRFVSVIAGAFNMLGLFVLGRSVTSRWQVGVMASFLYLISPFAIVYDRMALYDSLVATFAIWNLWLAVVLARSPQLDSALLLGIGLGLGMLNKTSGFISLYLLPLTLLVFDLKKKKSNVRLAQWVGCIAIAALISQAMYAVLRLSPFFHMIGQKDLVFVYSFSEWIASPFRFLEGNLKGLFDWLVGYLTQPVFILAVLAIFIGVGGISKKILLYLWWIVPFVGLATFGKVLYPRFIFFMTMPLILLASMSLERIRIFLGNRGVFYLLLGLLLLPSMLTSAYVLIAPDRAPIPLSDRGQYFEGWPSGWGVREVISLLDKESKEGKVTLYTDGTFGLLPYAIELYLVDKPNITIRGIWPLPKRMPDEVLSISEDERTFLLVNASQTPLAWPLELVRAYQKGSGSKEFLRLYGIRVTEAYKKSRQTQSEQKL